MVARIEVGFGMGACNFITYNELLQLLLVKFAGFQRCGIIYSPILFIKVVG